MLLALKLFLSGVPSWAWKWLAIAALGMALVAFGWVKGNQHGTEKLTDYKAAQALEANRIITRQGKVTERVIVEYTEAKAKTKTVTEYVDREVTRYAESNPGSCIDDEFVRLHNAAAANSFSQPAPRPNGAGRIAQPIIEHQGFGRLDYDYGKLRSGAPKY